MLNLVASVSGIDVLSVAVGICVVVLFVARAIQGRKHPVDISTRYTKKRIICLFIVIPLLCGIIAFVSITVAPQYKRFFPLLFFSILLIGNLMVWGRKPSTNAPAQLSNSKEGLSIDEQRKQRHRICFILVLLVLLIVLLALIGLYLFLHTKSIIGLLLIILSVLPALCIPDQTSKLFRLGNAQSGKENN